MGWVGKDLTGDVQLYLRRQTFFARFSVFYALEGFLPDHDHQIPVVQKTQNVTIIAIMIIVVKVDEIEHVNPPPGPTKADLEGTATLRLIGRVAHFRRACFAHVMS